MVGDAHSHLGSRVVVGSEARRVESAVQAGGSIRYRYTAREHRRALEEEAVHREWNWRGRGDTDGKRMAAGRELEREGRWREGCK